MTFKDMWHNGSKRLLVILIVISVVILLVVAGVAAGIFYLSIRMEKISAKQGDIVGQVNDNTTSISNLSRDVNKGWQSFQKENPTQPVPQILDGEKPAVVLVPAIESPTPEPAPTVQTRVKTRTVIKYKAKPTPTPFRFFGTPKKKS